MPTSLDLHPDLCRERQERLRQRLTERQLDRAIIVSRESVQWLTDFALEL